MSEKKATFVSFWLFLLLGCLLFIAIKKNFQIFKWVSAPLITVGYTTLYLRFARWLQK